MWQGSSVGQSMRFIPAASRVRISPLLPQCIYPGCLFRLRGLFLCPVFCLASPLPRTPPSLQPSVPKSLPLLLSVHKHAVPASPDQSFAPASIYYVHILMIRRPGSPESRMPLPDCQKSTRSAQNHERTGCPKSGGRSVPASRRGLRPDCCTEQRSCSRHRPEQKDRCSQGHERLSQHVPLISAPDTLA